MNSSFIHNAILFLSFYTFISSSLASSNDIVSLLAFKSKADLHNNKLTSYSYTNTATLCKWQGVLECNHFINGSKIIRLVLENLNLSGVFAANTLARLDQLRVLSLRNNSLHGPIPDLSGFVNLKALFLDQNNFTGVIPFSISSLHRLRTLDLSSNGLSGGIPVGLSELDRLSYIRLDSNHLNGTIPVFNQSSLQVFNVSVNFLAGKVPGTQALSRFGPGLFSNNLGLCGEVVRIECGRPVFSKNSTQTQQIVNGITNSSSMKKNKRIGLIVGFSTGLFLAIALALCVMMMLAKKSEAKKRRKGVTETMEMAEAADAAAEVMRMEFEANELEKKVRKLHQGISEKKSGLLVFCPRGEPQVYTVEQLMKASAELLGSGTIGMTYKALVDGRVIVCVKRLDATKLGSGITNEAFERHMEVVGALCHPNVVALEAYFHMKEEKLLVYEYQQNGSLFSLIHGSKSTRARPLHWTSCLKIAEDVAQGLSYLHQTHNLVHGNLKSSNVLLGTDFEALITDHSLSALFPCNTIPDHLPAHKAPKIKLPHNEPTAKSDVYSFGILLLELLTGKAVSSEEMSADEVVKWVRLSREKDGGGEMMEVKRLEMMTEVAIACNVSSPEMRPTMWQVIKMLQEIKEAAVVMEDCGLGTIHSTQEKL